MPALDDPEQFHPHAAILMRNCPSWAHVVGDIPLRGHGAVL